MRHLFLLASFAAAIACGGTGATASSSLTTGTYQYTSTVGGPNGGIPWQGTLEITYATSDSIAAIWHVTSQYAAFDPKAGLGFRNGDAYVLYAYAVNTTFAHRIRPDLSCSVNEVLGNAGTCSLSR